MTVRGQIQASEQRQQRRFAGARRSDDRNAFASIYAETHVIKNGQTTLWTANLFADVMCCKNGGVAVGFIFHA